MTKILIIGPAWVGDMIMAQSLFKLIKQRDPLTQIDVLAPAWTFSLLSRMPEVTNAIEMPITHGELKLRARYQLGKQLRHNKYDQAIMMANSFKSALIPWFARIPKRTGWLGEFRYGLLNDIRYLDKKRYPLMIEQFMALGLAKDQPLPAKYPYPAFNVSEASVAQSLAKHKPIWRGKPILALCPGAAFGPSKRWPETYFGEVAKQKLADGWDVWIVGAKQDAPLAATIMAITDNACDDMTGRVDLADTIDLLSLASGVICNDSGLMHMTAALQKPLIAIYGSTSPDFTPPLSDHAQQLKLSLDCQPCFKRTCPLTHHRCMRDITPAQVLSAMAGWR